MWVILILKPFNKKKYSTRQNLSYSNRFSVSHNFFSSYPKKSIIEWTKKYQISKSIADDFCCCGKMPGFFFRRASANQIFLLFDFQFATNFRFGRGKRKKKFGKFEKSSINSIMDSDGIDGIREWGESGKLDFLGGCSQKTSCIIHFSPSAVFLNPKKTFCQKSVFWKN